MNRSYIQKRDKSKRKKEKKEFTVREYTRHHYVSSNQASKTASVCFNIAIIREHARGAGDKVRGIIQRRTAGHWYDLVATVDVLAQMGYSPQHRSFEQQSGQPASDRTEAYRCFQKCRARRPD